MNVLFDEDSIKCNLCDSAGAKLLFIKDNYIFLKCKKCGLIYICLSNQNLSKEEYDLNYLRKYKKRYLYENLGELKTKLNSWKSKIKKIDLIKDRGKLLDVGCATGFFLKAAKDDAWDVKGVEISAEMSKLAMDNFELDVVTGTLESARFPSNYFDVVTLWDLIEHVPDPTSTMLEVNRILKKNGLTVIRTINFKSLNQYIFKNKWRYYLPPEHLYYFSPKLLMLLLRKTHFDILRMNTEFMFHAFKQGLVNKSSSNYEHVIEKLEIPISIVLNTFCRIMNWGDIIEIYGQK